MAAETEKLKQCCMCDYSVGGSDDKSVVGVSLGSEGREKRNQATWKMSTSGEEEQGRSPSRFNVVLIHIHGSLAACERMAEVTNLIKAPAQFVKAQILGSGHVTRLTSQM